MHVESLASQEIQHAFSKISLVNISKDTNLEFSIYCQVLALNRGEDLKILSIKIVLPDNLFQLLRNFLSQRWIKRFMSQNVRQVMDTSIDDLMNRLIHPQMCRLVR